MNCKHNYFLIKTIIIEHPYDLLYGEKMEQPTYFQLGRDKVSVICTHCNNIKNIND